MPLLKKFIIKNFKGIQEAEISIDVKKTSDVITLIGLNESGKTTILERVHFNRGHILLLQSSWHIPVV